MKYFVFLILSGTLLLACKRDQSILADRLFEAGRYEEALENYNEYLRLKPRHIKSLYNRGRCYEALGRYEEAVEDYQKVLKLDPKNTNALLSIGKNFYRQDNYEQAVFFYDKALKLERSNFIAHFLKGRALHKQGLIKEALTEYTDAININSEYGESYLYRGAIRLYLKQAHMACADFQKAASLNVEGAEEAIKQNCK